MYEDDVQRNRDEARKKALERLEQRSKDRLTHLRLIHYQPPRPTFEERLTADDLQLLHSMGIGIV